MEGDGQRNANRGRSQLLRVGVVIPAHNEEQTIGSVLEAIPGDLVEVVAVGANRCSDRTAEIAAAAGAIVVEEDRKGYGWACQAAVDALPNAVNTLVFVDGDLADDPSRIDDLLEPLRRGFDVVIGSRVRGECEPGALTPQARLGNALAVTLIRWLYGFAYTDLGPFRAVRRDVFDALALREFTFGWTVELQVKAVQRGYRVTEVPVPYRRRGGGRSKVSGTVTGVIGAGCGILGTIARLAWQDRNRRR